MSTPRAASSLPVEPTGPAGRRGPRRRWTRLTSRAARRISLPTATLLLHLVSRAIRSLPLAIRYLPADAASLPLVVFPTRVCATARHNFAVMRGVPPDDPSAAALAHTSIRNYGRMAIDFLAACTDSAERIQARTTVVNVRYLLEARSDGCGVLLAVPHVGTWDVAAVVAEAYNVPITVVTEDNWVTELVAGARATHGVSLAPRDRSLRALYRTLARNECVVLLSDIAHVGVQTVSVPFFGHPAPFPAGAARLAARTRAPIVIVFAVRLPDKTYRVELLPPLRSGLSGSKDEQVRALTTAIVERFQRIIAAHPSQWYPFHAIWPGVHPGPARRPAPRS